MVFTVQTNSGRGLCAPQRSKLFPSRPGLGFEFRKPTKNGSKPPDAVHDPNAVICVAAAIVADPFPVANLFSSVATGLLVFLGLVATQVSKPASPIPNVTGDADSNRRSSKSGSADSDTRTEETVKEVLSVSTPVEPKKAPLNVIEARNWISEWRNRKPDVVVSFPLVEVKEDATETVSTKPTANETVNAVNLSNEEVKADDAVQQVVVKPAISGDAVQQATATPAISEDTNTLDEGNPLQQLVRILKNIKPIGQIADFLKRMWDAILRLLGTGSGSGAAA